MRRFLPLLLTAVIGVAALASSATASTPAVQVTEAKGPAFPVRTFVISLAASRALTVGKVHVTENGGDVVDVTLVPASAAKATTFGVVLVIDASLSMKGKPIRSAIEAARSFVALRNPRQQVALVTFNSTPRVVLPFTSSDMRIDAALAELPSVAYGTHIHDAVAKAEAMLAAANIQSGSIVVLSDGADTGSSTSAAQVVAAARSAHVRLFTIGLRSKTFRARTLANLASAGGGEYALAATTKDIESLFDTLGERLSREYVLSYKSLSGPDTRVSVNVQIAGLGVDSAAYQTPALPLQSVPPYHPSLGSRIWRSPVVMVLLALLGAVVAPLLLFGLLRPRRSDLPGRMAEFVSVPGLQRHNPKETARASQLAGDGQPGFWARFNTTLEIAQIRTSAAMLVAWTLIGTVFAMLFIFLVTGSFWWSLLGLLVAYAVREWATRKLARRRRNFAEQLPDALQVISSALRSGHSFAGALAVVVESAGEPMKTEMQRVVADEQRGVPLQDSIEVVATRMASDDLRQVGLVAELQREAGGNSAEVVDRVAETVRERFALLRLIHTLTVQGRMSRWIVSLLPLAIILMLQIINPHYIHPLVSTAGGKVALGFAAAMLVGGSYVIKKIVDIKV